jgi:hypothetical protein
VKITFGCEIAQCKLSAEDAMTQVRVRVSVRVRIRMRVMATKQN